MQLAEVLSLRAEFERRRVDKERDAKWLLDAKLDREKQEKKELDKERAEQEMIDLMVTTAFASEVEIEDFRVELDEMNEASVKALMENEENAEAVRTRIDRMFAEAQTLPDGRKVFKTRDGLRVFDQNGEEIPTEQIDPGEINDKLTRWEDWQDALQERTRLDEERTQILDFQRDADAARDRLDEGGITKDELADMQEKLKDKMPLAVARQLPDFAEPQPTDLKGEFAASARSPAAPLPQAAFAGPGGP